MKTVSVKYSNNSTIVTIMAEHLTDEDIRRYFAIGKPFNIGCGGNDLMATVESVIIHD